MSKFKDTMRGPYRLDSSHKEVKAPTPTGSEKNAATGALREIQKRINDTHHRIVFDPQFEELMERAESTKSIYGKLLACAILEHGGMENLTNGARWILSQLKKQQEKDDAT